MLKLDNLIKIAITGPESTGKSAISQQLADHYNTLWVPEFARVYLLQIERPYCYDDILQIARGQKKSEEAFEPVANNILFSDTELFVTKIWCNVRFGKCHSWIEDQLKKQLYDLYLLLDVDLPWEYDPLREHPEGRDLLLGLFKMELDKYGCNYRIISGVGDERLKNAIAVVDNLILNKSVTKPL
ncbi:MAG: AAA family ATPase [Bacteroidales bacterium]|nr:AAA family ATPase [Bacteroidales bacterium]